MIKRFHIIMAVVLGISLLSAVGCGTSSTLRGSIVGTVVDSQTNLGIAGASIVTSPSTDSVITDSNGSFAIPDIQPGVYTVTANAADYNSNSLTVTVDSGLSASCHIPVVSTGGSFSRNILPVLTVNCAIVGCHNEGASAANLRLNSYLNLMRGSKNGAIVYPYDASNSKLIKRIKGSETPRMPKDRPSLASSDQGLLANWVNGGARNN